MCTFVFTFCPDFVSKLTRVYARGLGEKVGRTLVCTLLVLEVMKVEKHVGSGPVVVSVLKNTNRF